MCACDQRGLRREVVEQLLTSSYADGPSIRKRCDIGSRSLRSDVHYVTPYEQRLAIRRELISRMARRVPGNRVGSHARRDQFWTAEWIPLASEHRRCCVARDLKELLRLSGACLAISSDSQKSLSSFAHALRRWETRARRFRIDAQHGRREGA